MNLYIYVTKYMHGLTYIYNYRKAFGVNGKKTVFQHAYKPEPFIKDLSVKEPKLGLLLCLLWHHLGWKVISVQNEKEFVAGAIPMLAGTTAGRMWNDWKKAFVPMWDQSPWQNEKTWNCHSQCRHVRFPILSVFTDRLIE